MVGIKVPKNVRVVRNNFVRTFLILFYVHDLGLFAHPPLMVIIEPPNRFNPFYMAINGHSSGVFY